MFGKYAAGFAEGSVQEWWEDFCTVQGNIDILFEHKVECAAATKV